MSQSCGTTCKHVVSSETDSDKHTHHLYHVLRADSATIKDGAREGARPLTISLTAYARPITVPSRSSTIALTSAAMSASTLTLRTWPAALKIDYNASQAYREWRSCNTTHMNVFADNGSHFRDGQISVTCNRSQDNARIQANEGLELRDGVHDWSLDRSNDVGDQGDREAGRIKVGCQTASEGAIRVLCQRTQLHSVGLNFV